MKNLTLYPRLFALLVLGFILCTIIGTVTHEMGHCAVAKYQGRKPTLHYAFMYPGEPAGMQEFQSRYELHKDKIESNKPSPEKEAFLKYRRDLGKRLAKESFWITMGGPLQTMLAGTIGFVILWVRRKKLYAKEEFAFVDWLAVLLAYFWSRQVYNFIFSIDATFNTAKTSFASDEPRLSQYLNLPPWAFGMATCIVGGAILLWVTFRAIPFQQRLTFLISGITGCTMGWFIWMYWVGPIVLP